MSDASRRMGRPPNPETLTRARHYLELNSLYGVPVKTIAEREGLTASRIWDLLKAAREQLAAERGPDDPAEAAGQVRAAPEPRKMSEAALLRRAWLATKTNGRLRLVGREVRHFWMNVVLAIREEGDGCCLLFAETGYKNRAAFATAFEGSEDELALLLESRLLEEIEAGGIGLPAKLGLTRGERIGGPMPARSRPDPSQLRMLQVLTGGRLDSSEVPFGLKRTTPFDSSELPTSLESNSSEVPVFGATSLESVVLAHAADADDSRKEINSLASASALAAARADSSEVAPKPGTSLESDSSEIGRLTGELTTLAKLGRQPNARELQLVGGWQASGLSADTMRAVIETTLGRRGGTPPVSLNYFDKSMREVLAPAAASITAAGATEARSSPLSEADQALRTLLRPAGEAWVKDRSCPFPPDPASFKTAAADGRQWLEFWHAWDKAGRLDRLKPPDFTTLTQQRAIYDARMLEIEEALTEPEDSG